jgi:ferredoxin-thioredoxin reductase catalytic subunit/rubredoxin
MKTDIKAIKEKVDRLLEKLKKEGQAAGYLLNPDDEMTRELLEGLITNDQRYGYQACPCRLATGEKTKDLDIVCPCDYRDADLGEHHTCYCGLYVSEEIAGGNREVKPIPERRIMAEDQNPSRGKAENLDASAWKLPTPVWRCRVCGYLCGRENPPELCPICKVKKERFERFL